MIVDGGKGLRAAVRQAVRHQRCQWHKRENVVSVAKREQPVWRQRLQRATTVRSTTRPSPPSSRSSMSDRNQSAAGSLAEGLDETLTLHRLGVYGVLGRSLKTTNGLESINALIEERCAKVVTGRTRVKSLAGQHPRKVMGTGTCPGFVTLKRELSTRRVTSASQLRTYLGLLRDAIANAQSVTRRHASNVPGLLRDAIANAQTAGSFRTNVNPTIAAKALFGALDEMATNWILSKRRYDLSAESDVVVDLFVNGLKANT